MKPFILFILILCSSCSVDKLYRIKYEAKTRHYEQISFVEMVKKYMDKDKVAPGDIEGIYSVSSQVLKKSRGFLSSHERERTVDQKEHYAQVAIIKDNARNNREYIEVPVDKNYLSSYSVRGEFTRLSEGNILVLKHFEPKNKVLNYSFVYDQEKDILEGIRIETNGSVTYTYKLSFVKLYPKIMTAHN